MTDPLFDTCVMVDWSAAARPTPERPSKDAIWWCAARRRGAGVTVGAPVYERTRAAAMESLGTLVRAESSAGRRALIGFDFPFGYPAGTARRITGSDEALALWRWLAGEIEDGRDNANNRFDVAERINALFDGTGPFWGRPESWDHPGIPTRGRVRHGSDHPAERRLVERHHPSTQPVWKLYTTGSVGSQVLLGIAALERFRSRPDLAGEVAVWPFETGLEAPEGPCVLAEIYPSLLKPDPSEPIKDAGQVKAVAGALARLDARGELADLFAGDPGLTGDERDLVAREEAWILGVGHLDRFREAA
ncbi:molybdopterin guanine dinucleotide synthesis [Rhodobacteraceae bacterium NNCM2]|nr:molybdopterin guanine dinucleotide synthesis [Coraliihabitans acroporae]